MAAGELAAWAAARRAASCSRMRSSAAARSAAWRSISCDSSRSSVLRFSASISFWSSESSTSAANSCCSASGLEVGEGGLGVVGGVGGVLRRGLLVGLHDLEVFPGGVEAVEQVGVAVGLHVEDGLLHGGVGERIGGQRVEALRRGRS